MRSAMRSTLRLWRSRAKSLQPFRASRTVAGCQRFQLRRVIGRPLRRMQQRPANKCCVCAWQKRLAAGRVRNRSLRTLASLQGGIAAGLQAQLDSDLVGLAVVAFFKAVEHAQHFVDGVAVVARPLAEGFATLAEPLLDLVGGHCRGSCEKVCLPLFVCCW